MAIEPTLSIVIPVRDSYDSLKRTLDSIAGQKVRPLEIIVVDDGSVTPVDLPDLKDSITVFRHPAPLGPAAARNRGAGIAIGDIILFIDADVVLASDVTQRILLSMEEQPGISAVQGIYSSALPEGMNLFTRYQNHYYHFVFNNVSSAFPAICATFCFAIRRQVFSDMGGFDTRIQKPTVEDEAFGYSLANAGHTIYLDRDCQVMHLAFYRFNSLIRRKLRMSFYQAINLFDGVKPPLLSDSSSNTTHHPVDVLAAILLSPLLLLALLFMIPAFWGLLLLYVAANARFWRYLFHVESPVFAMEMVFTTWMDHLSIFSGLTAGTVFFWMSRLK